MSESGMNTSLEQPAGDVGRGLIAWFAHNPVAANLLMALIVFAGALSASMLAVQYLPDVEPRTISVFAPFPGASPNQVERDINRRMEEAVIGLPGVGRVISTARPELGRLDVEAGRFANIQSVYNEVENAVRGIERFPPLGADSVSVRVNRPAQSVITLALVSEFADEAGLRVAAEQLRDELLPLPEVSQTAIVGVRDREISIELSDVQLRRFDLTVNDVVSRIGQSSANVTSGDLRTAGGNIVIQANQQRMRGGEFLDIPLIRSGDMELTIGDLTEVRDEFIDDPVLARIDGAPAVLVRVGVARGQSYDELGAAVEGLLDGYVPPAGVAIEIWEDQVGVMERMMRSLVENGVLGVALVLIVLLLFFDLRAAFWTTAGIPLCILGALALCGLLGVSLNIITIICIFIFLGIIVDDAVVVSESIATSRGRGLEGVAASVDGAGAVLKPVMLGAATTLLVLMPFWFISAEQYQMYRLLPLVGAFLLFVSTVEAFLILPAHLSRGTNWSRPPLSGIQRRANRWLDTLRDRVVVRAVSWSVRNVGAAIGLAAVVLAAAATLLGLRAVPVDLYSVGGMRHGMVQADIELPAGTSFETTVAVAERFAAAADNINGALEGDDPVVSVSLIAGQSVGGVLRANRRGDNIATVRAQLAPHQWRDITAREVMALWRQSIADSPEVEHAVFQTGLAAAENEAQYALRMDGGDLAGATAAFRSALEAIPGVVYVNESFREGRRELELELTPVGEAAGLTEAAVAAVLRGRMHGGEAQRIQRGRDELRVMVRYPPAERASLEQLLDEPIDLPGGGIAPLSELVELVERRHAAEITRIDGLPATIVSARVNQGQLALADLVSRMEREVIPTIVADFAGLEVQVSGALRHTDRTLEMLALASAMALLVAYVLVAISLGSYWKPLVVVAGVPACAAGAVFAHWFLGWPLGLTSLLGIIAAAGVAMNDALILIFRYGALKSAHPDLPAIAVSSAAARQRFRAVFLTTVTTVIGLAPLLYARGDELILFVPFVVSIFGGLTLSLLFVLFLAPALVMVFEGARDSE